MPLEQLSNNLDFFSFYSASKQGTPSLTVTVDVWKHLTSTNTSSQIVTAGSATEVGGGLYRYQLSSASVTGEGEYICIFKTTSTTPDQQHIPSIWCVQKAGSEYLDAAVTTRASATDYTTARATKLDNLDVAVSTGAAPAIWNYLAASATTAASLGKLLVDNVNATIASRMATFTYTAPDNTSVGTILARTDVATSTRASATDYTTARATKLDNLDVAISSRQASGNVTIAGYAAGQDPATLTGVTTTRGAKLDNLDATVSSRLAPAGITSLQADVTAIKTPVVANIDATISSRLASASYTSTSITSLQADVTAIKVKTDANLDTTVSSRLTPAGITSLQADVTAIVNVSPANSAIYSKVVDAIYYATDARDKAWLNYQVLYGVTTPAGSMSEKLNAVKATVDANLNATVSSRLAASAYAPSSGVGAIAYTVTLLQPGTITPIAGAEVWITSNSAGTTVVAGTLLTNGSGQSTFMVDAGSYYLWVQATGWNFTNPQAFVVS